MNAGGTDLRRRMPFIVLGAILVVGVIIGVIVSLVGARTTAPEQTSGPDPEPTLSPRSGTPMPVQAGVLGESTEITGLYGNGSILVNRATWHTTGDIPPTEGRQYLTLEFEVETREGLIVLQKEMFTAYEADETEHVPTIGSGEPNDLGNTEVTPGSPVTFTVSFDLQPGATTVIMADEGYNSLVVYEVPGP